MQAVKFEYQKDIRRVAFEKVLSLEEIKTIAKSLFRDTLPQSFVLKYKDDEGDMITVESDRELAEAFRLYKDKGILKITVFPAVVQKKEVPLMPRVEPISNIKQPQEPVSNIQKPQEPVSDIQEKSAMEQFY